MISPIMISPAPIARAQSRLRFALAAIVVMLLGAPSAADAQGLVQGVQQGAREGNKAAETNKSTTEKSTTTGQAGANAKLSTEQRTKITTVIRNQHVESANNVNFSISVGARVPREGVRFYPLPTEVVTIYPEWRGYQFILVRNEILVIDPNTYEIVAVLNT